VQRDLKPGNELLPFPSMSRHHRIWRHAFKDECISDSTRLMEISPAKSISRGTSNKSAVSLLNPIAFFLLWQCTDDHPALFLAFFPARNDGLVRQKAQSAEKITQQSLVATMQQSNNRQNS